MWAQILNTLFGLWLMIAPGLFHYGKAASNNGYIVGPVIVTFAMVAWWQCTRGVREFNIPLAFWLLVSPWLLGYENEIPVFSDMATGLLVLLFSQVKGKTNVKYGGGWHSLLTSDHP